MWGRRRRDRPARGRGPTPGAIVILHDGGGNRSQTVAALPAVIDGISAARYQIVPTCAG